jgi:hypothetical protein
VSGVFERAAGFFLLPAAAKHAEPAALPPAVRAVVVGTPSDAVPLAAAHALALRAAVRAPAALVAVWQPSAPEREARRGAAARAAARLAERLSAHGLPSVARGRLSWLALPAETTAAAAAVRRASAIVEGPLVTAMGGPRPAELDTLVAEHDLAIVAADPESPLARAALACLADLGLTASARSPLRRGIPRSLALAGLAAPHAAWSDSGGLAAAHRRQEWPGGTAAAFDGGGVDAGGIDAASDRGGVDAGSIGAASDRGGVDAGSIAAASDREGFDAGGLAPPRCEGSSR